MISREHVRDLPEDTYLIADLIGLKVYTEDHEYLGILDHVVQSAGNDLYEIILDKDKTKKVLIPAVGEFIKKIDVENCRIEVKLIEGLIE